jgi:hypothetical protein
MVLGSGRPRNDRPRGGRSWWRILRGAWRGPGKSHYIGNQAEHRRWVTVQEEYRRLRETYGVAFDGRDVWVLSLLRPFRAGFGLNLEPRASSWAVAWRPFGVGEGWLPQWLAADQSTRRSGTVPRWGQRQATLITKPRKAVSRINGRDHSADSGDVVAGGGVVELARVRRAASRCFWA